MEQVGKAYALFDCKAPKGTIEAEINGIRGMVGTPSKLETSLSEGMVTLRGDPQLEAIARQAEEAGIKYALTVTYPGATNKSAADEAAAIINQAYQSPALFEKGEPFKGEIFFKQGRGYVSRE